MNVDAVFPMSGSHHHDFRKGKRLGKKDHLIKWKKPAKPEWMDAQTYADFPDTIMVRETTTVDTRRGHRTRSRILVTTFLNAKEVSPQDLGGLYDFRWFVEINK